MSIGFEKLYFYKACSAASTGGGTSIGVEIPNANYGQTGTEYRDIWIR